MGRADDSAVDRVRSFLRDARAEARVEEFARGTPTAAHAARAVGCELRHIVKSLVFECDGRVVLAMVPGDRRADAPKVAAAAGAPTATIASPARVREATGFEPGAVSPFAPTRVDAVFVDRAILNLGRVWVGAGSTRHMAGLAPTELVRLTRATAADLTSDD
ncbi:MAG TPA: YbaK/EbsC family protein [Gaiellaceae bacterium]|nr:YbaK/EbsC family protein [Gaiellaceae bacterium]